jgi:plasmid stabilization system protein ParE
MIILSNRALRDLRRIREEIEFHDPELAARKIDEIMDACERLVRRPFMGRRGREEKTRELSVNPWIVVYQEPKDFLAPEDAEFDEYDVKLITTSRFSPFGTAAKTARLDFSAPPAQYPPSFAAVLRGFAPRRVLCCGVVEACSTRCRANFPRFLTGCAAVAR